MTTRCIQRKRPRFGQPPLALLLVFCLCAIIPAPAAEKFSLSPAGDPQRITVRYYDGKGEEKSILAERRSYNIPLRSGRPVGWGFCAIVNHAGGRHYLGLEEDAYVQLPSGIYGVTFKRLTARYSPSLVPSITPPYDETTRLWRDFENTEAPLLRFFTTSTDLRMPDELDAALFGNESAVNPRPSMQTTKMEVNGAMLSVTLVRANREAVLQYDTKQEPWALKRAVVLGKEVDLAAQDRRDAEAKASRHALILESIATGHPPRALVTALSETRAEIQVTGGPREEHFWSCVLRYTDNQNIAHQTELQFNADVHSWPIQKCTMDGTDLPLNPEDDKDAQLQKTWQKLVKQRFKVRDGK